MTVHNQRWYGDEGSQGAVYFDTLDTATGSLSKADWDTLRFGMVCSVPQSFADTKSQIEVLCNWTKRCKYDAATQTTQVLDKKKDSALASYLDFLDKAAKFKPATN